MHEYCLQNVQTSKDAVSAIETGDAQRLADCMVAAQDAFDRVAGNCPVQLASPVLHRVINDPFVKSLSLAVKGEFYRLVLWL